jgi:short-subunit dehydrogenase
MLAVNTVGALAWLNLGAALFDRQGAGHLVGLGSVAGDRGRQSIYVYAAAKAGLNTFLQGLRNRLHASGVPVITIKPSPWCRPYSR